jgi:hypothetical protein
MSSACGGSAEPNPSATALGSVHLANPAPENSESHGSNWESAWIDLGGEG